MSLSQRLLAALIVCAPLFGSPFTFSTGDPDGSVATASRIPQPGILGIETADDFILSSTSTIIQQATFTGLFVGAGPFSVQDVNIDLYHVFPVDSDTGRIPNVTTRVNSPADTEFDGRSFSGGGLTFSTTVLNPAFTANNSILNGIFPSPNQKTGGEGAVTGEEVMFNVTFSTPFTLPADHYFFVPTVQMTGGEFYWLSAPKPIVAPGTPFLPDLQTWIRNQDLDPDWSRVGTDVIGSGAHNAAFSLAGTAIPEPSTFGFMAGGALALLLVRRRRQTR